MRFIFWIISLLCITSAHAGFDSDSTILVPSKTPFFKNADTLNKKRFAAVNATSLLALYGSYHYINNAWWADSKNPFILMAVVLVLHKLLILEETLFMQRA